MNLLNLLIAVPAIGFVLTLFLPRSNAKLIRMFTLGVALVTFVLSLGLVTGFDAANTGLQFETNTVWIPNPEIHWHLGVDGLSLWLVVLATLLTPIAMLMSWNQIQDRVLEFFAFLLLLECGLVGVFAAYDLFLFYVFWELVLVPMYFLIGMWGGKKAVYATVKFFVYTMAASVLMLAAMIFLYLKTGTFDYSTVLAAVESGRAAITHTEETMLFLAFFLAFAVKVALFPLHTWLPDAYTESPAGATVMLAAVMSKMGAYGIVRFCLPMFPTASRENANWIVVLAIIGIIYGALVALVQTDVKRVIAYSSVSHLGFVVLGIFTFTQMGLDGAVYQMLNHGISTGALFVLAGLLYERRKSLAIADFGGIADVAPWFTTIFLITTLASIGLPTLNNFIGEFLVLQGSAQANFTWTVFASLGVILSACYMLWMMQRVFYGKAGEEIRRVFTDFSPREWACILPLVVMMVWMGMYTQTFLPAVSASNSKMLEKMSVPLRVSNPVGGGNLHAR